MVFREWWTVDGNEAHLARLCILMLDACLQVTDGTMPRASTPMNAMYSRVSSLAAIAPASRRTPVFQTLLMDQTSHPGSPLSAGLMPFGKTSHHSRLPESCRSRCIYLGK